MRTRIPWFCKELKQLNKQDIEKIHRKSIVHTQPYGNKQWRKTPQIAVFSHGCDSHAMRSCTNSYLQLNRWFFFKTVFFNSRGKKERQKPAGPKSFSELSKTRLLCLVLLIWTAHVIFLSLETVFSWRVRMDTPVSFSMEEEEIFQAKKVPWASLFSCLIAFRISWPNFRMQCRKCAVPCCKDFA